MFPTYICHRNHMTGRLGAPFFPIRGMRFRRPAIVLYIFAVPACVFLQITFFTNDRCFGRVHVTSCSCQMPTIHLQVGAPTPCRTGSVRSTATIRVRVEHPLQLRRQPVLQGNHVRSTGSSIARLCPDVWKFLVTYIWEREAFAFPPEMSHVLYAHHKKGRTKYRRARFIAQ